MRLSYIRRQTKFISYSYKQMKDIIAEKEIQFILSFFVTSRYGKKQIENDILNIVGKNDEGITSSTRKLCQRTYV
jgi:hypothetical protein